jgi:hypothetical protein
MTTTNHSIQSLASAFANWRQSRPYLRSPVPDNLRQQAVAMLTQHSVSQIIEALGITRSMLRSWQQTREENAASAATFISLPFTEPKRQELRESLSFMLTLDQTREFCIEGNFSPEQLTALMRGVVAGMEQP